MGILSSKSSITRYSLQKNVTPEEVVTALTTGLFQEPVSVVTESTALPETVSGWVSVDHPYTPEAFDPETLFVGSYAVFAFRMDQKKVPSRMVKARIARIEAHRLKESGREFLSKNEKCEIKDAAMFELLQQVPYTPQVVEVTLNLETMELWVFATAKGLCEAFDDLMRRTFITTRCVRLFPYTLALPAPEGFGLLSPAEMDKLAITEEANIFEGACDA